MKIKSINPKLVRMTYDKSTIHNCLIILAVIYCNDLQDEYNQLVNSLCRRICS